MFQKSTLAVRLKQGKKTPDGHDIECAQTTDEEFGCNKAEDERDIAYIAFLLAFMSMAFMHSGEGLADSFAEASKMDISETSKPFIIHRFFFFIAASICGYSTKQFHIRRVAVFGGVLNVFGGFLSCFSSKTEFLMVTLGGVTGFGSGLLYSTSIILVNQYVRVKKPLALAVAFWGLVFSRYIYPKLLITAFKNGGFEAFVTVYILSLLFGIFQATRIPKSPKLLIPLREVMEKIQEALLESNRRRSQSRHIPQPSASDFPKNLILVREDVNNNPSRHELKFMKSYLRSITAPYLNTKLWIVVYTYAMFFFSFYVFSLIAVHHARLRGISKDSLHSVCLLSFAFQGAGALLCSLIGSFKTISKDFLLVFAYLALFLQFFDFTLAKTEVHFWLLFLSLEAFFGFAYVAFVPVLSKSVGKKHFPVAFDFANVFRGLTAFVSVYIVENDQNTSERIEGLLQICSGVMGLSAMSLLSFMIAQYAKRILEQHCSKNHQEN